MLSKNRNIKMLNKLDTLNIFMDLLMYRVLYLKRKEYIYTKTATTKRVREKKITAISPGSKPRV